MRKKPARGQSAKHTGTRKHGGTRKHHQVRQKGAAGPAHSTGAPVHVVAKHPHHAKARQVTPGDIALCPAEAVAAAARLAGWAVSGTDVLDLYARCADGPSSGFTIAAALTAASRFGIGDARLGDFGGSAIGDLFEQRPETGWLPLAHPFPAGGFVSADDRQARSDNQVIGRAAEEAEHALILGVDLPGPHAVTVAPDGTWWSWGEPFDPAEWPGLVIEEAWAVTWR